MAQDVVSEWMKVIKQSHENTDTKPTAATSVVVKRKKKLKNPSAKPSGENHTKDENSTGDETVSKKPRREQGDSSSTLDNNNEERTSKKDNSNDGCDVKKRLSPVKPLKSEEQKPRVGKIKRPAHTKFRSTGRF